MTGALVDGNGHLEFKHDGGRVRESQAKWLVIPIPCSCDANPLSGNCLIRGRVRMSAHHLNFEE
jgi:hypothetical protein